jgi:hypothetical protein
MMIGLMDSPVGLENDGRIATGCRSVAVRTVPKIGVGVGVAVGVGVGVAVTITVSLSPLSKATPLLLSPL